MTLRQWVELDADVFRSRPELTAFETGLIESEQRLNEQGFTHGLLAIDHLTRDQWRVTFELLMLV